MSKRILVIDDDKAVRKSFILALEDSGYELATAESGEKGIQMQQAVGYDLIFLDLKMPGLNGADTLRELRKTERNIPIYIITAFHREFFSELRDLRNSGIYFELLQKPLSSEDILEITKAILG